VWFAGNAGNIAIIIAHLEEGGLFGSVSLQFVQIEFTGVAGGSHRLFSLSLNAAFGFIALFLLARVFFLAFGKA
jgi:hypothetical protein